MASQPHSAETPHDVGTQRPHPEADPHEIDEPEVDGIRRAPDSLDEKGLTAHYARHGPVDEQQAPRPVPLAVGRGGGVSVSSPARAVYSELRAISAPGPMADASIVGG